jgi:hypothetical protein
LKPLDHPFQLAAFTLILSLAANAPAQAHSTTRSHEPKATTKEPWAFSLVTDGYLVPDDVSYVNPNFTADHRWLHLEARYNSENLHTGSLWFGYNFSAGKKLVLNATPMIGGVFGRTNGIAPGCEASLTYKKIQPPLRTNMSSILAIAPAASTTPGRKSLTRQSTGSVWASSHNAPGPTTQHWTYSGASSPVSPTKTLRSPPTSSTPAGPHQR